MIDGQPRDGADVAIARLLLELQAQDLLLRSGQAGDGPEHVVHGLLRFEQARRRRLGRGPRLQVRLVERLGALLLAPQVERLVPADAEQPRPQMAVEQCRILPAQLEERCLDRVLRAIGLAEQVGGVPEERALEPFECGRDPARPARLPLAGSLLQGQDLSLPMLNTRQQPLLLTRAYHSAAASWRAALPCPLPTLSWQPLPSRPPLELMSVNRTPAPRHRSSSRVGPISSARGRRWTWARPCTSTSRASAPSASSRMRNS